ncbi:MAG TPA: choice-of-anchor Q domain-containing protein [Fimbriiglobus sp.]|nr:choice-of-anchor Q domain-containing protein [Fimbriiglobus sp.]
MTPFAPHSAGQRAKYLLTRPTLPLRARLGVHLLEDRVTPATFTVANTADAGDGSLRQAVLDANKATGADEIVFDSLFDAKQTIALTSGQLTISDSVTITGPGADLLTVNRAAATNFRIVRSTAKSLTVSGMTISSGSVTGIGGGLYSLGTGSAVILNAVTISGNTAAGGGGLFVGGAGATANLNAVTISGNTATGTGLGTGGGGVLMDGGATLTVRDSTVSGNTAVESGGGIYFFYSGSLQVQNSTISGNKVTNNSKYYGGAGIYFFGSATLFSVQNTTITGNESASSGGGIFATRFTGTIDVQNSTITGNKAAGTDTGQGGGGITRFSGGGSINVVSSVVSGNTNTKAPDILSTGTVNVNFSAVGDKTGFTLTGANNVPFGTNLMLGALADNGGPTQTIAPLTGSPLIDAGDNAGGLLTDQRGPSFVRVFGPKADIGAVEVQPPAVVSITTPTVSPTNATDLTFTVTFNQNLTGLSATNFKLTTTGGVTGTVGTVTGSGRTWTVSVNTIAGTGTLRLDLSSAAGVTPGVRVVPFTGGQVVTIDQTPPTVQTITLLDPDPVTTPTARFQVTFSEPVTALTINNLALTATGTVTGASIDDVSGAGADWTVTVTVGTGNGTVALVVDNSTGVADAAGNALAGLPFSDASYVVQPMVLGITGPASSGAGTVPFTVVFNQPVSGLTAANFAAVVTGTVSATVGTPTGSGTTWTVPVTRILGNGTLRLDMVNGTGVTPDVQLLPFTGGTVVRIDRILPTVTAIAPVGPNPTNGSTVDFAVTFPEDIEGLTAANFAVTTDGTLAEVGITSVTGAGAVWTVSVSTGTGDGTIRLDMVNDDGSVFPPIDGLPFTGGTPAVVDRTSPNALATAPTGANPTNGGTAQFTVTFDESVVGVTAANFALAAAGVSGAAVTGLSGSGATYTVTVFTGSGDGTLILTLADPTGVADVAGNPLSGTPFDATPLKVDKTFPTAVSIVPVGPAATNAAAVAFTITFSEPVLGVAPLNFAVVSSGSIAGAALTSLTTTDNRVYTAVVSTGTGDGTVRVDLFSPVGITDAVGQPVIAGLTGQPVAIDRTAPQVTATRSAGQGALTGEQPIRFTVTFTEPVTGFGRDDVVVGGTAGPGTVRVTGSGASYEVEVSGLSASGPVGLTVRGGAAVDAAGNANLVSPPGEVVSFVRSAGGVPDSFVTRAVTPLTVAAPGVLANDTDPDGRPLTAVLVTAPPASAGTVQLSPDGSFTFRPAVGFVGGTTFTYATFNGFVAGAAATVTITVEPGLGLSAVAAGPGGGPQVTVYNPDGTVRFNFFVYAPTFTGGVYVATGDVTGDGVEDIVTGAGLGGGPHVRVFDGVTGAEVSSFFAYDPGVRGGVTVAVGDVDGDGRADLVTGAGPGAGPHVKVFDATGTERFGFFAYEPTFTGGVSVAVGDLNGDRAADIATGPLVGGGPHVQVFDGRTQQVLMSFFAFDPKARGGASVAIGDAYADGTAELIAGSGTSSAIRVFRGDSNGVQLTGFFLADPVSAKAVRVATDDADGDGRTDHLLVASGPGTTPVVRRYDLSTFARVNDLLNFPSDFLGGLFVG